MIALFGQRTRTDRLVELTACVDAVLLASGARAGHALADCVGSSLREAVQVHSALVNLRRTEGPGPASRVTDESSRARYCLGPEAARYAREWLLRGPREGDLPVQACEPTLRDLAEGLRGYGLRPVVGDLTARLPAAARDQGWRAVRALVLGHQPFRMDESKGWAVHAVRREAWLARLDGVPTDPGGLPHPLIQLRFPGPMLLRMLENLRGASRKASESLVLAKASDVQALAREVAELRAQVSELLVLAKQQASSG